jgi:hypothetical protein
MLVAVFPLRISLFRGTATKCVTVVVAAAPAEAAMKDNQCFTFQLTKEKKNKRERKKRTYRITQISKDISSKNIYFLVMRTEAKTGAIR